MIVTIEGVLMPQEGMYREVKRFAYTQEESNDLNGGDSVRDANQALKIVKQITGYSITVGMPPRGKEYQPLYVIQIQVSNTHKMYSSYRVAYRKFNGCPVVASEDMMEIHAAIKKVLRNAMADYNESKKNKNKAA